MCTDAPSSRTSMMRMLDMPALEAEDAIDAPLLEESRNPCRNAVFAGAEVLR